MDAATIALISRTTSAPGDVFVQRIVVERARRLDLAKNKASLAMKHEPAKKRLRARQPHPS